MADNTSWIEKAELALKGESLSGVDVVRGRARFIAPPTLAQDLFAITLAAITIVIMRTQAVRDLGMATFALTAFAFGISARAALALIRLRAAAQVFGEGRRYAIVSTHEGLLVRTPLIELPIEKQDLLDVVLDESWSERNSSHGDIHLVLHPRLARTHLTLPGVFEDPSAAIAEQIMRWRGLRGIGTAPTTDAPLASKVYEDVARGERPNDVAVIRLGSKWLLRAPVLATLAAAAFLAGGNALWSSVLSGSNVVFVVAGIALLGVASPTLWLLRTRRELASRLGIGAVLTPHALLVRLRSGVYSLSWNEVQRVSSNVSRRWGWLTGMRIDHEVVATRHHGEPVTLDDAYLAAPAAVVAAIANAYREGRVARLDKAAIA